MNLNIQVEFSDENSNFANLTNNKETLLRKFIIRNLKIRHETFLADLSALIITSRLSGAGPFLIRPLAS